MNMLFIYKDKSGIVGGRQKKVQKVEKAEKYRTLFTQIIRGFKTIYMN